jgi:hypothetical protein
MPTPEERRATARYLQQMRQLGLIGDPEPITADSPIVVPREAQEPRPSVPRTAPSTLEPPDELEHVSPLEYDRAPGTFPLTNEAEEALVTRDGLAQEPFGDIAEASRPIQASDERRRGRAARRERLAQARAQEQAREEALAERRATEGEVGPVTQFVRTIGQDASFGHLDEIMGGVNTAYNTIAGRAGPGDLSERYDRNRDDYRLWLERGAEDQPEATTLGHLGTFGLGMVSPAGPIAKWTQAAPSALGRITRSTAAGAGIGAAAGEGFSDAPLGSSESMASMGTGALVGGTLGGALSTVGEGARRVAGGRAQQRALRERARKILEGEDELPNFSGTAVDDLEFDEALRAPAEAMESTVPGRARTPVSGPIPEEELTIRSLVTEPWRGDAASQRLRSVGVQTIPQARAVSKMSGGIDAFADDLDRAGVSQRGELLQTTTGAARAERLRDRALAQRQRAIARAEELGAGVDATDVADRLRAEAAPFRRTTGDTARANAAYLERIADEIEALPVREALPSEIAGAADNAYAAVLSRVELAANQGRSAIGELQDEISTAIANGNMGLARQLSGFLNRSRTMPLPQGVVEREVQSYQRGARFDRNSGNATLPDSIELDRTIRRELAQARIRGMEAADPQLARSFQNAQRGYQVGVTAVPQGSASRMRLGEILRSVSPSDMGAGGAGALTGATIGTAVAGPVGGAVGSAAGGFIGAATNRLFRRFEPTIFASINERATTLQQQTSGQLSPGAARLVAMLERDPDAAGRAGRSLLNAAVRGPRALAAVWRVVSGQNATLRAAAQELEQLPEGGSEWSDVVSASGDETTNEWEGIQ